MQKVNLVVPSSIIEDFEKTIELIPGEEFELAATKGVVDDAPKEFWTFGILPKQMIDEIQDKYRHDCMIETPSGKFFVYPYEQVWELDEKRFEWGEKFIVLKS